VCASRRTNRGLACARAGQVNVPRAAGPRPETFAEHVCEVGVMLLASPAAAPDSQCRSAFPQCASLSSSKLEIAFVLAHVHAASIHVDAIGMVWDTTAGSVTRDMKQASLQAGTHRLHERRPPCWCIPRYPNHVNARCPQLQPWQTQLRPIA